MLWELFDKPGFMKLVRPKQSAILDFGYNHNGLFWLREQQNRVVLFRQELNWHADFLGQIIYYADAFGTGTQIDTMAFAMSTLRGFITLPYHL